MSVNTKISLSSYNCHGLGPGKIDYITSLCTRHDFVFLQEHWLISDNLNIFIDQIPNISCHGISAMDTSQLLAGRPYGGCSILWRSSIACKVSPVECPSKRMCAITVDLPQVKLLLINVYMPTDTRYDRQNIIEYDNLLIDISALSERLGVDHIVIAGDFNTDFGRGQSPHTVSLLRFLNQETLFEPSSYIDYTFESLSNGERSWLDHFFLSENLRSQSLDYSVIHEGDNLSDHSAIVLELLIPVCFVDASVHSTTPGKLNWDRASDEAISCYQRRLCSALTQLSVPFEALGCANPKCSDHLLLIDKYCHDISECLIQAGQKSIPKSKSSSTRIPGWNDYVRPLREDCIFWHQIWQQCGSPVAGWVAQVRRVTRAKYHKAVRYVKHRRHEIIAQKMADSLISDSQRDLWRESRKINSAGKPSPSNVDGRTGDGHIANVFVQNYKELYNSVSFSDHDMTQLQCSIDRKINDFCCSGKCPSSHEILTTDVEAAMKYMKAGKYDGYLSTDHLLHGGSELYLHLSYLYTMMTRHGFCPSSVLLSTIVPIPKNLRKSVNDSSNYRGIALNSPFGKLFEIIMLVIHRDSLSTTDLQFGYKRGLSTTSCTFVADEVIQYYLNSDNDVHVMLLDASKAFDCVEYVTLFNRLLTIGLCPLVVRVLLYMHVSQSVRVRWRYNMSDMFSVSNGVKQGGVLSPVLFSVYTDIMLHDLRQCGAGCYVGNVFCGALAYADDVVILAPNKAALTQMLRVAQKCALKLKLRFNGSKSQYLVYRGKASSCPANMSINFCGAIVVESNQGVHLGNILGLSPNRDIVSNAIIDLNRRTNLLLSRFSFCSPDVRYKLFKTHCVIAYGSPLWDFDDPAVADYWTAWRKCVRRVWGIPYRTHCDLLPGICNDRDVETQLISRSVKFLKSALASENYLVSISSRLVLDGSRSALSNTVSYIADKYSIGRDVVVCDLSLPRIPVGPVYGAIRDFAVARHGARGDERDHFDQVLAHLCTE